MMDHTRKRRFWRIVNYTVIFLVLSMLFVRKQQPVLVCLAFGVAAFLMFVVSRKVGNSFGPTHFFRAYFVKTQQLAAASTVTYFTLVVLLNFEWLGNALLLLVVLANALMAGVISRIFYVGKALRGKIKNVPKKPTKKHK